MSVCFPIQCWECWSISNVGEFELSVIIGGVPWKLSISELWNDVDGLTILREWFQCACESKRSILSYCSLWQIKIITCNLWWGRWGKLRTKWVGKRSVWDKTNIYCVYLISTVRLISTRAYCVYLKQCELAVAIQSYWCYLCLQNLKFE